MGNGLHFVLYSFILLENPYTTRLFIKFNPLFFSEYQHCVQHNLNRNSPQVFSFNKIILLN
jgi:hypothetical protein